MLAIDRAFAEHALLRAGSEADCEPHAGNSRVRALTEKASTPATPAPPRYQGHAREAAATPARPAGSARAPRCGTSSSVDARSTG